MALKLKKYPKKPKQSAPLKSWEAYEAKVKLVDKHNAGIKSDHAKKQRIIKKISGMR